MDTKRRLLSANRISGFYESNESVILSQIIKITGKYISLCNYFALSCIKFTYTMDRPWDSDHQPHFLIAMITGFPWQPE